MRPEQNGVDYIMNITSEMLVYEGSITESAAATYTEDDIILPVNQFSDQGVIIYGFEVGSAEPQDLPAAGDTVEAIVVGLYTSSQTDTVGIENQETIARTLFKKLGDGTDWLFFFEEREGIPLLCQRKRQCVQGENGPRRQKEKEKTLNNLTLFSFFDKI